MLTVHPREQLPLQRAQQRRLKFEQAQAARRESDSGYPAVALPGHWWEGPSIDQTLRITYGRTATGETPTQTLQYTTRASGELAFTDAVVPRGSLSSHGFGVAEAIGLARALGTLPPRCIVYAIEAADFTPGAAPSAEVERAAHAVAALILAELATLPPP